MEKAIIGILPGNQFTGLAAYIPGKRKFALIKSGTLPKALMMVDGLCKMFDVEHVLILDERLHPSNRIRLPILLSEKERAKRSAIHNMVEIWEAHAQELIREHRILSFEMVDPRDHTYGIDKDKFVLEHNHLSATTQQGRDAGMLCLNYRFERVK